MPPKTSRKLRALFDSIVWRILALVFVFTSFTAATVWLGAREGVSPIYTAPITVTASVLVAWAVARTAVEPLIQATKAAAKMAHGDFSVRISPQSRDEIGQLAEAFNSMAQDLAEIDRLHREMVANVSHELRTPVAALRSRLENLADGIEEPTPENLQAAVRQIERLTELLNYLLDLSRVESGAAGLELSQIAVAPLIDEAIEVSGLAAQRRRMSVNFVSHVEPADLTVNADLTRLLQVLTNVLENATKHTPPGTRVTVEALRVKQNLRIDIIDMGQGIAPSDRERIFGRFQRGAGSTAVGGGTGIGLAIARWAVSLHGGSITVADSDSGARFRILLPLNGPKQSRGSASARTAPESEPAP